MARIKGTQIADLVRAVRGMHKQGVVALPEHLERYLEEDIWSATGTRTPTSAT